LKFPAGCSGLSCALLSVGYFLSVAQGLGPLPHDIKSCTVTFNLSIFYFVGPAQAHLNSTPQLLASDRCSVAQGAQLGSGDLRMHAAA